MPYTVRISLRSKTVKTVSLLLIHLLPQAAKATFPHKGRLAQSGVKQKFKAVKHTYKPQFIVQILICRSPKPSPAGKGDRASGG